MTSEDLAKRLDGHELKQFDGVVAGICAEAADAGKVIVFGASDDLMELRGAINDEVGAWDADGVIAWIADGVLLQSECAHDDCPYFEREKKKALQIRAYWCKPGDDRAWTYRLPETIDCAKFDIFEDGQPWCRGLVFDVRSKP